MEPESNRSEQQRRPAAAAAFELAVKRFTEPGDGSAHLEEILAQLRAAWDPEDMEDHRRKERVRLRRILDHAPIGVWHIGATGRLEFVNRTFCDLVGIPEERFLEVTHYGELYDEATAQRCMDSDAKALANPGIHISHERVRGQDGTFHDLEITKERLEDESGRVVGLIGLSLDITERMEAEAREEALAQMGLQLTTSTTEEGTAAIATNTAYAIWGWDACFLMRYDRASDTVTSLIDVDTVNGEQVTVHDPSVTKTPTPLLRRMFSEGAQLVLRQDPQDPTPTTTRFGDTSHPSLSMMYVPIRHEGRPIGCISVQSYEKNRYTKADLATLQSLADHCGGALVRVRAEAQLERERVRFRHLFENSPIATWFEDFTRVELWMNSLRAQGVTDLQAFLKAHPGEVARALGLIRILDVNQARFQ